MNQFKSRKSLPFKILLSLLVLSICAFILLQVSTNRFNNDSIFSIVLACGLIAFLVWIYYGTFYSLSEQYLIYTSGPIRGKISVSTINRITKNKTMWAGLKPATATKGLILRYNRYDEIYISPETNDSFIEQILKINPNIEVVSE